MSRLGQPFVDSGNRIGNLQGGRLHTNGLLLHLTNGLRARFAPALRFVQLAELLQALAVSLNQILGHGTLTQPDARGRQTVRSPEKFIESVLRPIKQQSELLLLKCSSIVVPDRPVKGFAQRRGSRDQLHRLRRQRDVEVELANDSTV